MDRNRSEMAEPPPIEMEQVAEVLRENQKLITLGRLAASIAHEINNPLESITNLLYLMEQDRPEKAKEYLKLAQRELSRVAQISKQTLTFSRETSGPVRVQLAELIEEVLGLHARKIGDKNLRVARQYDTYEQVTVFPGEMRQVLSNLISNAIEATPARGRIVIRIRASRRWSNGDGRGLRVSIGDNGSGIAEPVRQRLGEPFFTTKGQSGTGLGLWVTRSIVTRYGGNMQLRSSVSGTRHGTVFSLFMPLNMRPVTVFPSGEATEGGSRWRGLRLVRHEGTSGGTASSNSDDSSQSSEEPPPASRRPQMRASGD
ncbi:MAG TPA: HAMP domain-containing sensor histidine kinase [Silvibacterium sp.]|nr:HAMP domain-containing sensor histidine kinase [Silvibacterium sp.]